MQRGSGRYLSFGRTGLFHIVFLVIHDLELSEECRVPATAQTDKECEKRSQDDCLLSMKAERRTDT
jgi:hypothetical protein